MGGRRRPDAGERRRRQTGATVAADVVAFVSAAVGVDAAFVAGGRLVVPFAYEDGDHGVVAVVAGAWRPRRSVAALAHSCRPMRRP